MRIKKLLHLLDEMLSGEFGLMEKLYRKVLEITIMRKQVKISQIQWIESLVNQIIQRHQSAF